MTPSLAFWKRCQQHLTAGRAVYLVWVVEHSRHSPGTTGARLAVAADGDVWGTVGGGVMEAEIVARAGRRLAHGSADGGSVAELRTLHHRRDPASGEASGMICAGRQTNLSYLCRPATDASAVDLLVDLLETGENGILEVDPSGLVVTGEVTDPEADLATPARRLERIGDAWRYREELLERRRVAVFGGGHCGLALARQMARLDWHVEAFDARRGGFENELREVARTVIGPYGEAASRIAHPRSTAAVVMTPSMPEDVEALAAVLRRPFPFVGVMGAPAKLAEIRRRLGEAGFGGDDFGRLTAPVGLAIGSDTPEEIAVSVAAQLIAWNGGAGSR